MRKLYIQIGAVLQMVRYKNLALAALTLILIRYFFVQPLLQNMGLDLAMPLIWFVLLIISTIFISAAGYVINDYFDRKTDLLNHPDKVIVGKIISRRMAMVLHQVFNSIGVLSGIFLSYKIGHLSFSLIPILVAGLLWFYSTTYKKQLIIGNVIVAFLTGLVPFTVIIYDIPMVNQYYGEAISLLNLNLFPVIYWVGAFSIFAFLTNLIREIIKDVEDFEGDNAFGRNTIPIAFGIKTTKIIIISLIMITILGILIAFYQLILINYPSIIILSTGIYMGLLILIPYIVLSIRVFRAKVKEDYSFASFLSKSIMLFGIFYGLLFRYLLK